jgi:hypothetical protein
VTAVEEGEDEAREVEATEGQAGREAKKKLCISIEIYKLSIARENPQVLRA